MMFILKIIFNLFVRNCFIAGIEAPELIIHKFGPVPKPPEQLELIDPLAADEAELAEKFRKLEEPEKKAPHS